MKKMILLLVLTSCLFMSCEKDNLASNPDYVEVTVKMVDAVCNYAILEIQEPSLKKYGSSKFEYKGKIYDGVIYTTITCANSNLLNSQSNNNPPAEAPILYKVLISEKALKEQNCDLASCRALPYKLPEKFYYVYKTGTVF